MASKPRPKFAPRAKPAATKPSVRIALPRPWLRRMLWCAGFCLSILALLLFWMAREAAAIDVSQLNQVPERTQIYDFRGRTIGVLHGENRIFIPIQDVPLVFREALLAREDNRFYDHGGVDWFGVIRAAIRNVKEGDIVQGASTLTMQLSRNRFELTGRNFKRKLVEAMLSRRLEQHYSKDQILEAYINIVYFGAGQYGLEQASRAYFEKPAKDLTLSESAMLVGLIRSPNRFSPFRDLDGACHEMGMVLDRMVETRRLDQEIANVAKAVIPAIRPPHRRSMADSWSMDLIRNELDLILDSQNITHGGLRVFTTLDLDIQNAAELAMEEHLASFENDKGYSQQTRAQFSTLSAALPKDAPPVQPKYLQGAAVFIDNATGGLRAVVGGRDVRQSRFNRAMQANRQVGSLFKPFVYGAAFEAGLSTSANIDDGPIRSGEIARAPRSWRPQNSDGTFHGMQPISYGLIRSRNTMSVRVGNYAGLERVRAMADRAGIASDIPRFPAIYLGAFESNLRAMVSAYTAFANRGVRPRPHVITEIQDRFGKRVFLTGMVSTRTMSAGAAVATSRILAQVMQPGGTAAGAASYGVDFPCAGKTGTTDNYRDAWFIGYNALLTGGVWVGFDQRDQGLSKGYGARLSMPIWAKVMVAAKQSGYQFGPLP